MVSGKWYSNQRKREKEKKKERIEKKKRIASLNTTLELNDHHLCESSTLECCTHSTGESLHTSLVSLVYGNGWRDVSAIIGASERLRSEMQRQRDRERVCV